LLSQHRGECGEKRDKQACVHETCDGDDLTRRGFLDGWNSGGFAWNSRLVEGKEDCTEKGC